MRLAILFLTFLLIIPVFADAGVVINEIAWMGDLESSRNEWIELKGDSTTDFSGWRLYAKSNEDVISPDILLTGRSIVENGFLVLYQGASNDYTGLLNNPGEILILENSFGEVVDEVNGLDGWDIDGDGEPEGYNSPEQKQTAQRTLSGTWITADATPGEENYEPQSSSSEEPDETTQESNTTQSSSENTQSSSSGSIPSSVGEKRITADAGSDGIAVVGVPHRFEGIGFGFEGEPLTKADFLWSFGDGTQMRGQVISHIFQYPGKYRVALSVSSGDITGSDYITITVTEAEILISEVKPGEDGFVEIWNNSEYDIDISGWIISNGQLAFHFPRPTIIISGSYLVISEEIAGIDFPDAGSIALFYSNAKITDSLSYSGFPEPDEGFHKIDGAVKIGLASPGSGKFVERVSKNPRINSRENPRDNSGAAAENVLGATEAAIEDAGENETTSAAEDTDDMQAEEQAALAQKAVTDDAKSIFSSIWFWFAAALVLGAFSATGVFAFKKYL